MQTELKGKRTRKKETRFFEGTFSLTSERSMEKGPISKSHTHKHWGKGSKTFTKDAYHLFCLPGQDFQEHA